MSKKLREQYIKQPPRQKDESHSGNPSHGPAFCPRCRSHYDLRSWKYPTPETWYALQKNEDHRIKFVLCPACKMVKERLFEGQIVIEHIPREHLFDLLRLIYHFAEKSEARSPEHRLIAVAGDEKKLIVTTTENQLAGRLAKKIAESWRHRVLVDVTFSREPYEKEFVRLVFTDGEGALPLNQ